MFDRDTATAVEQFQQGNHKTVNGIVDSEVAQLLLDQHLYDGYKDNGKLPHGYLYKVRVRGREHLDSQ